MGWITRFRYLAGGTLIFLTVVAASHFWSLEVSKNAAERSLRLDLSWIGMHGRLEATTLEKYVARYAVSGTTQDRENARLYYQILQGRLDMWDRGVFKKFLDSRPDRAAQLAQLKRRIDGLSNYFASLEDPAAQRHILAELQTARAAIDGIGGDAHTAGVIESSRAYQDLRQNQRNQNLIFVLVLAVGSGLLAAIFFQNRSLQRAHRTARAIAERNGFLARHDALTKLPNRRAFVASMKAMRGPARSEEDHIGILAIDLDGFKAVNDTLGHTAGDELLKIVADRLLRAARKFDKNNIVSRFGGDEFVALVNLPEGSCPVVIAEDIRRAVEEPVQLGKVPASVAASIGIAVSDITDDPDRNLILDADLALSVAKSRGKGQVVHFDRALRNEIERQRHIERDLVTAINAGQIFANYQIQVDLATGRLSGAEALARWRHPTLGDISPVEFIPIAESTGDIVELGYSILRQACRDALLFPDDIPVSVNLSVAQTMDDKLVSTVATILGETGLPASRLKLEVTESVLMHDAERVVVALHELQSIGVSIALDDFGTGYSSLAYLRNFRWNELKIDRSFVRSVLDEPLDLIIIRAVRMLAEEIGAKVIVEGVETVEQERILKAVHCDIGQGFLYGRPVSAEDLPTTILRAHASASLEYGPAPDSNVKLARRH
ncbi:putative bifunctional diguanylate cyclase/phosphodiesterase [Nitratireductor luteus]|uniref:putative bifunctional diguanylate cyclase/phosphodiesterase n=1 Tax=Nitratireductor luteus TaxID=2976980 RepID=UPI00223F4ACA|nr:EAL domain-containing protein [Nitratireductor luteus]